MQRLILAMLTAVLCATSAFADDEADPPLRYEHVMVPVKHGIFTVHLSTYLYAPPGPGPFPLVVLNHGKAPGGTHQPDTKFIWQAKKFIARGYAVLVPNREGIANSGGVYFHGCDVESAARHWADSVEVAIDYARTLPFIDATRIVVIGQSQGGITTVALGERNLPGVLGIVNFAGGSRDEKCGGWQDGLVDDYKAFGADSKVPALFVYGDNDSYWGDGTLSKRFFEAYHAGNPNSAYFDEGAFAEGDSHMFFHHASGYETWAPTLWQFFDSLGLNSQVLPEDEKAIEAANVQQVFEKPVEK
ncbi:alpha/beta hydrolase family protein [Paraburkholderia sp. J12]|uniref:alpha/beta hydrolase family protein n=1 Tax=Paraburkholderia sp. J12 TaxID=2805432 RepID=UPI002ABDC21A|nr:prolyl oligopeptidase family serine peptidase [Paraburkholderia sp. J12]